MSDDLPPMPDDDTTTPADPFEAELVAYLDGELDPAAARKVEARLASDPEARAKAAALKKTFDLLDYLPRHEPSPNFTTRTLDRLPAMQADPGSRPPATSAGRTSGSAAPVGGGVPVPVPAAAVVSSSMPVPLVTGSLSVPVPVPAPAPPPARMRWGLWAAGILVAATVCAAAGYFISAFLAPPPQNNPPGDL